MKEGGRERETDRSFRSPKDLEIPAPPTSCVNLASHFPSLNLIFHICEVGIITHSHGNEGDVLPGRHLVWIHSGVPEASLCPPHLLLLWAPSSLGFSTSFVGILTRGSVLLGLSVQTGAH